MRNKENKLYRERYRKHAKTLTDDSLITDIVMASEYVKTNQIDFNDLSVKSWLVALEIATKELNKRIDN